MGSSGRRLGTWDPFGFGLIYTVDPAAAGQSQPLGTANDCWFVRVTGGGTISKIGLYVDVSSGAISVAVYRNLGVGRSAIPGTRLATSGAIACPSSGFAEVSLGASVAVSPGDWFALSCDNTTATFRAAHGSNVGNGIYAGRIARQGTSHPAPASPSVSPGAARGVLLVGVP